MLMVFEDFKLSLNYSLKVRYDFCKFTLQRIFFLLFFFGGGIDHHFVIDSTVPMSFKLSANVTCLEADVPLTFVYFFT